MSRNQKWSSNEESSVGTLLQSGKSISDIATYLGRSTSSVRDKIRRMDTSVITKKSKSMPIKLIAPVNRQPVSVPTTREINKTRKLTTPFSQKEFSDTVKVLNKMVFGDATKSGGASEYQYGIMNSSQGLITNGSNSTRLGTNKQEKAIVDAAYAILIAKYNA